LGDLGDLGCAVALPSTLGDLSTPHGNLGLGDLGDLGAATRNEEVLSCSPKICCLGLTI